MRHRLLDLEKKMFQYSYISNRNWLEHTIYNFTCNKLDGQSWIVHYMTREETGAIYYRTSIWIGQENLKLYFHQATKLKEQVDLIEA